jgi:hypothetical protein
VAASSESVFIATLYTSTLYLKYTHTRRRRSATARSSREFEPNRNPPRTSRLDHTREAHDSRHSREVHDTRARYTREIHERYTREVFYTRSRVPRRAEGQPTRALPTRAATRQPRPLRPLACLSPPPLHTLAPHSASTAPAQRQHSASHRSAARRRWRATYVRPTCHLRARSTCLPPPRRTPAPHACGSPP